MTAEETKNGMNRDDNIKKMPDPDYRFAPNIKSITPVEEKSKELFEKYYEICSDIGSFRSDHINKEAAKQSALICVDEILKFEEVARTFLPNMDNPSFWKEVKQHLLNL